MSESVNNFNGINKSKSLNNSIDYTKYINDKLLNIEEKLKRIEHKTAELQQRYSIQLNQMQLIRNRSLSFMYFVVEIL